MQRLLSARPTPALQGFVRGYAQRTYSLRDEIVEPSLPCVETIWSFLFGAGLRACFADGTVVDPPKTTIVGPNLRVGTHLRLANEVDLFAVFFLPAGFSDLFGVPLRAIVNTHCDATTVVAGAGSLWDELAGAPSFGARVRVADTWLAARVAGATRSRDMHMANVVARNRGIAHIPDLAGLYGLSVGSSSGGSRRRSGPRRSPSRALRDSNPRWTQKSPLRFARGATSPTSLVTSTRCTWFTTFSIWAGPRPNR